MGIDVDRDAALRLFGYRVRELRESSGLTQAALANRSGMHVTYLSGVERGKRNVGLWNIHCLASALGVEVSDLLAAPHAARD